MRLIDADALKKQVKELLDLAVKRVDDTPDNSPCYRMYVAQENERARLIDLIDNAPTVETYTIEDIQEMRENALILGAKLAQRPQGEWVKDEEHSIVFDMFKCTICGFWNGAEHFRFCPNCGAKMQKGGAENE